MIGVLVSQTAKFSLLFGCDDRCYTCRDTDRSCLSHSRSFSPRTQESSCRGCFFARSVSMFCSSNHFSKSNKRKEIAASTSSGEQYLSSIENEHLSSVPCPPSLPLLTPFLSTSRRVASQTHSFFLLSLPPVNSTLTNTARTELHSMITLHHANARGSRAGRLRIAHLCVPKQLSSTCHVSFLAAPDTDHKHKFSLTHFICFSCLSDILTFAHRPYDSRPYQHPQDLWSSSLIFPAMFHGRVADQHKIPSVTGYEPKIG